MSTTIGSRSFTGGYDLLTVVRKNIEIINEIIDVSNGVSYSLEEEVMIRNHNTCSGQTGKVDEIRSPSKAKSQGVLIIKLANGKLTNASFEQVIKLNKRPPT